MRRRNSSPRMGISDVDTQQLAELLRRSQGNLSTASFPSKKELFLAAVDRVMRRLQVELEASLARVDDPLEGVARRPRERFFAPSAEHPRVCQSLPGLRERSSKTARRRPITSIGCEMSSRWRELYRSLIAEGRVRDMSVERITDVISDLLYGTIFNNYFAGRSKPADEQARDVLDIVFCGIFSGAERARRG